MPNTDLLTLAQVAEMAGVHQNTVRKLTRDGLVTSHCEDMESGVLISLDAPRPKRFRYLYHPSAVPAVASAIHDKVTSQAAPPAAAPEQLTQTHNSVTLQVTPDELIRLRERIAEEKARADTAEALLKRAEGELSDVKHERERLWEQVQRLLPQAPQELNTATLQESPAPVKRRSLWDRLVGRDGNGQTN